MAANTSGRQRLNIQYDDWLVEMRRRYPNRNDVAFVCPVCHHRQTVGQFVAAAGDDGLRMAGFACIGRLMPKDQTSEAFSGKEGPCSYAGGGLFRLNPIVVVMPDLSKIEAFDFADHPLLVVGTNAELPEGGA